MRRRPSIRTGTTGFDPMEPIIPHIPSLLPPGLLRAPGLLLLALHPAFDVRLPSAGDAERARRHVFGDGRTRPHIGPLADRHRGNELRVAADKGTVLDHGLVLVH